jgi:hypothetical protein
MRRKPMPPRGGQPGHSSHASRKSRGPSHVEKMSIFDRLGDKNVFRRLDGPRHFRKQL